MLLNSAKLVGLCERQLLSFAFKESSRRCGGLGGLAVTASRLHHVQREASLCPIPCLVGEASEREAGPAAVPQGEEEQATWGSLSPNRWDCWAVARRGVFCTQR
ncbi:hypothetical protein JD844_008051 [Phrynosoma platyrhinos]|uniref:Arginine vasotocin receptor n=1 Tax=Phrynosoma platyrhinos TaxID=52577 RepID=A0ABQ7TE08_PHRPL|nr:hypothetical protein JD844_008051 [Phrynosoma platyrhinos]